MKKLSAKIISFVLAVTMAFTSYVPAYAAEDAADLDDSSAYAASSTSAETDEPTADPDDQDGEDEESEGKQDDEETPAVSEDTEPVENEEPEEVTDEAQELSSAEEITEEEDEVLTAASENAITLRYHVNSLEETYKEVVVEPEIDPENENELKVDEYGNYVYLFPEVVDLGEPTWKYHKFGGWYTAPDNDPANPEPENNMQGEPIIPGVTRIQWIDYTNKTADAYAHWNGEAISVVLAGGDDVHGHLEFIGDNNEWSEEAVKVGETFELTQNLLPDDHVTFGNGYYLIPDKGYTLKSVSIGESKTKPETYAAREVYFYCYGTYTWDVTEDMIKDSGEKAELVIYTEWEPVQLYLAVSENYGDIHRVDTEPFTYDSVIPEVTVSKKGFHFDGWKGDVIPGLTKASDTGYRVGYEGEGKNLDITGKWWYEVYAQASFSPLTYTVTYNINAAGSSKIVKRYSASRKNQYIDLITKTDLSTNSSFDKDKFIGWIPAHGEQVFDENATVADLAEYFDNETNIELYGKWKGSSYNIKFDGNGDTENKMDDIKGVAFDQQVDVVNKFVREGYKFTGFNLKKDGTGIGFGEDPDGHIIIERLTSVNGATVTLYAQWEAVEEDLWIESIGGPVIEKKISVKRGEPIDPDGKLVPPDQAGYVFTGIYKDEAGKVKADLSKPYDGSFKKLYAGFEPIKYTVIYHSGGSKDTTKKFTYSVADEEYKKKTQGTKISYKSIFGKDDEIDGWFGDGFSLGNIFYEFDVVDAIKAHTDSSSKAVTVNIYANHKSQGEYYIIFVGGEGAVDGTFEAEDSFNVAGTVYKNIHCEQAYKGEAVILDGREFVKKGYNLEGWTYKNGNKTVTVKANATLKDLPTIKDDTDNYAIVSAKWSAKPVDYKITYNMGGGKLSSGSLAKTYKYDPGYELPQNMVKTGYKFDGWYLEKEFANRVYKLGKEAGEPNAETGAVTLYAKFDAVHYKINFTNGNKNVTESMVYDNPLYLGEERLDLVNEFSVPGRTLTGWKCDSTSKTYKLKDKIKNLTAKDETTVNLVAQYNDIKYKITYDYAGGKKIKNPASYITKNGVVINSPVRDGYIFDGWDVDKKTEGGECTRTLIETGENAGKYELQGYSDVVLKANWKLRKYKIHFMSSTAPTSIAMMETDFTESLKASEIAWGIRKVIEKLRETDPSADVSIIGFSETEGSQKATYTTGKDYPISKILANIPLEKHKDGYTEIYLYPVIDTKNTYYNIRYLEDDRYTLSKNIYNYKASKSAQALPKAVRKGYTFIKWEVSEPDVENKDKLLLNGAKIAANTAADLVLKPVFESKTFTVTFDYNGAKNGKKKIPAQVFKNVNYETGKYKAGDTDIDAEVPGARGSKEGYTFVGFASSKKATEPELAPGDSLKKLTGNSKVTYYAVWKAHTKTTAFRSDVEIDGTVSNAFEVDTTKYDDEHTYGKAVTLPKPAQEGYTFLGWKLISNNANAAKLTYDKTKKYVTKINANNDVAVAFRACFAENTYKLMLNPNGGQYKDKNGKLVKKAVLVGEYKYSDNAGSDFKGAAKLTARPGYKYRAAANGISIDKAGKKAAPEPFRLNVKNGSTVTYYIQWDKVTPSVPVNVLAKLEEGSEVDTYNLVVNWRGATPGPEGTGLGYEVEYSVTPAFTYSLSRFDSNVGEDNPIGVVVPAKNVWEFKKPVYADRPLYARVRQYMTDSAGNKVYSSWSGITRVQKSIMSE